MPSSPPEAAPEYLTDVDAVSPKPTLLPSPANIPILEMSMDPNFDAQITGPGGSVPLPDAQTAQNGHVTVNGALPTPLTQEADPSEANGSSSDAQVAPQDTQNVEVPAGTQAASEADGNHTEPHHTTNNISLSKQALNTANDAHSEDASHAAPPQPIADLAAQLVAQTENVIIPQEQTALEGVDIQALLDNFTSPTPAPTADVPSTGDQILPADITPSQPAQPQTTATGNASLPPRPPPQATPQGSAIPLTEDIRNYHKIPNANYRAQTNQSASPAVGIVSPGTLPPPPGISLPDLSAAAAAQLAPGREYRQRDSLDRAHDSEDETPWPREVQEQYDAFLAEERSHVDEGKWDHFPAGSRLFIGNLATEKVTKRDIFHVFHKHGKLAQISIKQAYGFVQFMDADSARRARDAEIDRPLRGKKINIEVSKASKNSRKNNDRDHGRRRSRSPEYGRGSRVDRYTSAPGPLNSNRGRDDYRPRRSSSPDRNRRNGRRVEHDIYDGSRRRSPSPYSRRYRDASPRRDRDSYDGLDLPRRHPQDVPDVQFLVLEDLDRSFVGYVTRGFADRGLRCDVMPLSSRHPLEAVLNRQAVEGVLGVSLLTRQAQIKGRIPLRIFKRHDRGQVSFDDYDDLEPNVCVDIVLRAKASQNPTPYGAPPPAQGYGIPQQAPAYNSFQPVAQPPPPQAAPILNAQAAQLLSALPQHELQNLLKAHGYQQGNNGPAHPQQQNPLAPLAPGAAVDIGQLLASIQTQQPQQAAAARPGVPDMDSIMANLSNYKR